jgi:hypothetical protein
MTGRCFSFSRRTPRAEEYGDVPDSNSSTYAECTEYASPRACRIHVRAGEGVQCQPGWRGGATRAAGRGKRGWGGEGIVRVVEAACPPWALWASAS